MYTRACFNNSLLKMERSRHRGPSIQSYNQIRALLAAVNRDVKFAGSCLKVTVLDPIFLEVRL